MGIIKKNAEGTADIVWDVKIAETLRRIKAGTTVRFTQKELGGVSEASFCATKYNLPDKDLYTIKVDTDSHTFEVTRAAQ